MGADEMLGGPIHHVCVQLLGVEPHPVDQKGIPDAGVVDAVGILFLDTAADGVEVLRHFRCLGDHDVPRQTAVHRQGEPVAGDGGGGAEVGDVALGVNACVRPSRPGAFDRMADHLGQGLFQGLRDCYVPLLHLPAVVGRAVVHEGQGNVSFHARSLLTGQRPRAGPRSRRRGRC